MKAVGDKADGKCKEKEEILIWVAEANRDKRKVWETFKNSADAESSHCGKLGPSQHLNTTFPE